jgi:hypothetical protein
MNRTFSGDVQFSNGEIGLSQCVWCRHRADDGDRCRAFPDGIPEAILKNRHDHCHPYDGDRGVRYEPEIVEIEFVDVESEDDFVPLTAEGSTEFGSSAETMPVSDDAVIIDGDMSGLGEDGVIFDLGDLAVE